MEIKLIKNRLIVTHELKSNETYKISKGRKFSSISIFKKPRILEGLSSSCEDGKEVLFIDYDNVDVDVIFRDYRALQQEFRIPQAYLFKTSRGFHVICLKKFNPEQVFNMIRCTHCDSAYSDMILRNKYRCWVLRIGKKGKRGRPKYLGRIGREIAPFSHLSKPHFDFLKKLYPKIKPLRNQEYDSCKKIYLQEYEAL